MGGCTGIVCGDHYLILYFIANYLLLFLMGPQTDFEFLVTQYLYMMYENKISSMDIHMIDVSL